MKKYHNIFKVYDLIDEVIYICDPETYDLIYCNKKAREILVSDFDENTFGNKCYKCLQGLDHPCVFCNNAALLKEKDITWSRVHPILRKPYLIHDSLIELDGKNYRLELAMDATRLDEAAADMLNLLNMEHHLTDCVRTLVHSDDFENSVDAVLQTILNYYNGERAYLFEFNHAKQIATNTFEICAPGIHPEIENLQGVPLHVMQFWLDLFAQQDMIVIDDLDSLNGDPTRQGEYETLSAQGIHSLIAVPIFTDGILSSFIGIDNPKINFEDKDFLTNLSYFIGVELKNYRYVQRLREINITDQMTDTRNRNAFMKLLMDHEEKGAHNTGVAFLDMNGLKYLNDTLGHEYGDKEIGVLGELLKKYFEKDEVFRISGDEFVIVQSDVDEKTFNDSIDRLRAELHKTGLAAIGSVYEESDVPLQLLQNRAEMIIYEEKQLYYMKDGRVDGRNVRPAYMDEILERMKSETYVVYLQPKFDVKTGTLHGAEALVRKQTEEGILIYPDEFVPALEKERIISTLDYSVFETVCKTAKKWQDLGFGDFEISTNISKVTFAEPDFVERLLEITGRTGVNCSNLYLEGGEAITKRQKSDFLHKIEILQQHGFKFVLDGIGSNSAPMELLGVNGLTAVKFDQSLVHSIQSGSRSQMVLAKLIELCHSLGMACVAKGVDNEEQMKAVEEAGCDRVQGFLFAKPMCIEDFEAKYLK